MDSYYYYVWRRNYTLCLALISSYYCIDPRRLNKTRKRRMWVTDIFLKRAEQGDYHNLIQEMRLNDTTKYFNYFRMSGDQFDKLLIQISDRIVKQDIVRESITPGERLALTLRYLASGDSMASISYAFRVGKSTVSSIINETCQAIWESLWEDVLEPPTKEKWKEISNGFENSWQMPNCIGAIDGKHIIIEAPPNSGSDFFNYKGSHSIVVMAVCDHRYKFTLVDIGARGRQSDGGIFRNSEIGRQLLSNKLNIPLEAPIEYGGHNIPYYIVGDEAFPLSCNLMRPYPGRFLPQTKRIYNYRLSRARRVIGNTFGIWVAKWRIFRRPINTSLETTEKIIKATICLHNYLITNEKEQYCPKNFVDQEDNYGHVINGQWREESAYINIPTVNRTSSNNATCKAVITRDQLTSYFMFEGAVPFQWNK